MREKLIKKRDIYQEISDKIDSGEINDRNFKENCEKYPELRWASYIAKAINLSFWLSFVYLIIYFFTH